MSAWGFFVFGLFWYPAGSLTSPGVCPVPLNPADRTAYTVLTGSAIVHNGSRGRGDTYMMQKLLIHAILELLRWLLDLVLNTPQD